MGKSERGPDMLDCLTYLREIEKSQQVTILLLMEPDGYGVGPRWRVHALAVPSGKAFVDGAVGVAAGVLWPHRDHGTFEGALFALMARLDAEIGRSEFLQIVHAP